MVKAHTVIVSDLHLGQRGYFSFIVGNYYNRVEDLIKLLSASTFERLILNGDTFDRKKKMWFSHQDIEFLELIKRLQETGKEIVFISGNHDHIQGEFGQMHVPILGEIILHREFKFEFHGKNYLVTHGDIFDTWNATWNPESQYWLIVDRIIGLSYRFTRLYRWLQWQTENIWKRAADEQAQHCIQHIKERWPGKKIVACIGHIHMHYITNDHDHKILNSGCWVGDKSGLISIDENGAKLHLIDHVSRTLEARSV